MYLSSNCIFRPYRYCGVIKAAHSDPVGMQTNRVTRDYPYVVGDPAVELALS